MRIRSRQSVSQAHTAADWPRISVITPSYNARRFIGETIESVLGQNYPDLEYIVVDGGSTDGTVELLQTYGDQICWISEPDRGQSHAINNGLRMATGEVLTYLNADDLYEPGALAEVGAFFVEHPSEAWVTGKCRVIDAKGRDVNSLVTTYRNLWLRLHSYDILQVINYVPQPATFWRREVTETIGLFQEQLFYTMDYDYWLRIGQRFRLSFINTYLATFRVHKESKTGTLKRDQFAEDLATARRYVSSRLKCALHAVHNKAIVSAYRWSGSNGDQA